jgi:hypothetical protein
MLHLVYLQSCGGEVWRGCLEISWCRDEEIKDGLTVHFREKTRSFIHVDMASGGQVLHSLAGFHLEGSSLSSCCGSPPECSIAQSFTGLRLSWKTKCYELEENTVPHTHESGFKVSWWSDMKRQSKDPEEGRPVFMVASHKR